MNHSPLKNQIDKIFSSHTSILYSYADISYSKFSKNYKSALVFAVPYGEQLSLSDYSEQKFENGIVKAKKEMDQIISELEDILKVSGVEYYIPAIAQKNETDLEAEFSFKYAAVHAGLGWIGKNDVLITREYGPRVRLSAVLINGEFEYGTVIEESGCPIECNLCVSICPCHALKGIMWHIYEQRENIIDYHLCNEKRSEYIKKFGRKNACGLCMVVCPFGISEKEKELLLFE